MYISSEETVPTRKVKGNEFNSISSHGKSNQLNSEIGIFTQLLILCNNQSHFRKCHILNYFSESSNMDCLGRNLHEFANFLSSFQSFVLKKILNIPLTKDYSQNKYDVSRFFKDRLLKGNLNKFYFLNVKIS